MLSLKLWKSIHNPPLRHPVFEYANQVTHQIDFSWLDTWHLTRLVKLLLIIFVARIVFANVSIIFLLPFLLPILVVVLFVIIPVLLPFAIFIYGLFLAASISERISEEQENHTYPLLCVSPDGPLTINWLISNGVLHRSPLFDWLYAITRILIIIGLVVLFIMGAISGFMVIRALSGNPAESLTEALSTLIETAVFLAVFYTGYIQSIVLGVVIGVLVPQVNTHKRVALSVAMMSYSAVQFGTYIVAFLLVFLVKMALFGHYRVLDLLLPILYFVIFFSSRELMLHWLWRQTIYRINAALEDRCY